MDRPSVLLICGEMSDERAWTPVVDRLDDWEVVVVPWPLGLSADIVQATREAVGTAVFDVVLTVRAGAAAGVDLARRGQVGALIMVEGNDVQAVHGTIDRIEGAVAVAKVFTDHDVEPIQDAMTAGDADLAAALLIEAFAQGPATEHRPVVQAMLATYVASTGMSPDAAPVIHPWASWLAEVSTPVLLVRLVQATEPGTFSARSVEALARQCPTARIVVLPLVNDDPPGLTHPDELADLVRQMAAAPEEVGTEVPVPASPVPEPTGPDENADIDAAIAVVNAYFSAPDDDEEAMALARAAADEHDGGDVLDGLVLLIVGLLAGRQGQQGITPAESLEEMSRTLRAIRRFGLG